MPRDTCNPNCLRLRCVSLQQLRRHLLRLYFDVYIARAGEDAKTGPLGLFTRSSAKIHIAPEGFDDAFWDELAAKTEGFSGRGIAKLMLAVQVRHANPRDAAVRYFGAS
jgi:ATPase family AAA domain-containing protein 3A/B